MRWHSSETLKTPGPTKRSPLTVGSRPSVEIRTLLRIETVTADGQVTTTIALAGDKDCPSDPTLAFRTVTDTKAHVKDGVWA